MWENTRRRREMERDRDGEGSPERRVFPGIPLYHSLAFRRESASDVIPWSGTWRQVHGGIRGVVLNIKTHERLTDPRKWLDFDEGRDEKARVRALRFERDFDSWKRRRGERARERERELVHERPFARWVNADRGFHFKAPWIWGDFCDVSCCFESSQELGGKRVYSRISEKYWITLEIHRFYWMCTNETWAPALRAGSVFYVKTEIWAKWVLEMWILWEISCGFINH